MKQRFPLPAMLAATCVLLSACHGKGVAETGEIRTSGIPWSGAGAYLASRLAESQGDWHEAATLLPLARKFNPDDPSLVFAQMIAELHNNQFPSAVSLARELRKAGSEKAMVDLVLMADAAMHDRWNDAQASLTALARQGGDNRYIVPLLKAWVQAGAKDIKAARATLADAMGLQGFGAVVMIHRAVMAPFLHEDPAKIEPEYLAALQAQPEVQPRWVELYTDYLARNGEAARARDLLGKLAQQEGQDTQSSVIAQLLLNLDKKRATAPIATPREGLAQALYDLSWLFAQQNLRSDAELFGLTAVSLDPKLDVAKLLLGDLARTESKDALAEQYYREIPRGSPYYAITQLSLAATLERDGRTPAAIDLLKEIAAETPRSSDAPSLLGDMMRNDKRFDEAIAAYSDAIARVGSSPSRRDWRLFYNRGTCFERSHRWPEAEKDFLTALQLMPDEPYVLNYLAYSWTERKQNLDKALGMLEKAVALRPEEGFIVDSLGWVYLQMGHVEKAVPLLERAVQLAPADATLNDHLGDAYWRAGRKNEARFQWQRALISNPEPDQVAPITAKLKNGLAKNGG
ncbi:MAG TPA: tetratricopeptide repeat protein [Dongiaceae bacterium]|jgi:tetratricopeptide (TPR) repeat protein|nr:tetratricopeptide repeat protein [Dongiaceae bacterium]